MNKEETPSFDEPLHVGRPNMGDREAFMRLAGEIFDRKVLTNDGPLLKELEARIADYLKVKHCVAMCNGTIALEIAIRALGLKGEVIVPSFTFIATAHALYWQGITPVFADIDPETHNLDPESVRKAITPRTTGIIAVHLWGRPAPVEELQAIADEHNLTLMFDAAHAFGCSHKGKLIGGFGKAEVLSFHATKSFNTFEGGAVVTNDDELAAAMRLMRNFGFVDYDKVIYPGTNGKMTEICAAMGIVNLAAFENIVQRNRSNYEVYQAECAKIPRVSLHRYNESENNNYHYIVMLIDMQCPVSRDSIVNMLHANGVKARRYFWPGCHRMEPYRSLYRDAVTHLPQTESIASRVILLPNGADITEDIISRVANIIAMAIDSPVVR